MHSFLEHGAACVGVLDEPSTHGQFNRRKPKPPSGVKNNRLVFLQAVRDEKLFERIHNGSLIPLARRYRPPELRQKEIVFYHGFGEEGISWLFKFFFL